MLRWPDSIGLPPFAPSPPWPAGRPSRNARSLEALGAARLAELLLHHTEGNAAARRALEVVPGDLIATLNLAQVLLELDPMQHRDEADRLLQQVIEAQPFGELANKAKDLRGTIADRDLRQDAVSYCLQALQLFEGMDQQRFIAVIQ